MSSLKEVDGKLLNVGGAHRTWFAITHANRIEIQSYMADAT